MADTITTIQLKDGQYLEAVGRRKTSIARVRLTENKSGKGSAVINDKPMTDYFGLKKAQTIVVEALSKVKGINKFNVSVRVQGGGVMSQAEATRHGLSRALVLYNGEWRDRLKKAGFLKRDPRAKERRKFGLKKARKRGQWSKR